MITIEGTELVKSVERKGGANGEWAKITFDNGLVFATWSASTIEAAEKCMNSSVPLAFIGNMKAREHEGRVYPNLVIDYGRVWGTPSEKQHEKAIAAAKAADEEDLPF
jgi:hypothetical protein